MSDSETTARVKRMNQLMDAEQVPTDYLAVRVSFVHVTKGMFGLKDDVLGQRVLIADTRQEAKKLALDLFTIVDQESKGHKADAFEV